LYKVVGYFRFLLSAHFVSSLFVAFFLDGKRETVFIAMKNMRDGICTKFLAYEKKERKKERGKP
jgi:hypothetical protein